MVFIGKLFYIKWDWGTVSEYNCKQQIHCDHSFVSSGSRFTSS